MRSQEGNSDREHSNKSGRSRRQAGIRDRLKKRRSGAHGAASPTGEETRDIVEMEPRAPLRGWKKAVAVPLVTVPLAAAGGGIYEAVSSHSFEASARVAAAAAMNASNKLEGPGTSLYYDSPASDDIARPDNTMSRVESAATNILGDIDMVPNLTDTVGPNQTAYDGYPLMSRDGWVNASKNAGILTASGEQLRNSLPRTGRDAHLVNTPQLSADLAKIGDDANAVVQKADAVLVMENNAAGAKNDSIRSFAAAAVATVAAGIGAATRPRRSR
ncbi:MAG TPA: hypothetical protein VF020_18630 [Chthoniobacterales bacterium]